jgi:probable rRNA maturation factor
VRRAAAEKRIAPSIEIVVEDKGWRGVAKDLRTQISRAAKLALALALAHAKDRPLPPELTILLTSDERVRTLNRQYRGKDRPTNVLSFPAAAGTYLGDIAIAYGVTAGEAERAGKPPLQHVLHLVVHGVLHLLGYDHEAPKQAKAMESLEADILALMGIPDPYRRHGRAA